MIFKNTFIICFLSLLSATISASLFNNTLYYDLLELHSKVSEQKIREKCDLLDLVIFPGFAKWQVEEGNRLLGIFQNVCQTLLNPALRETYDREGSDETFTVFEFGRYLLDEFYMNLFTGNNFVNVYPLPFIKNAHEQDKIGDFFEGLRKLYNTEFASYIRQHPQPPVQPMKSFSMIFGVWNIPEMYYPKVNPNLDLQEFLQFLDDIIQKYGPYIEARLPINNPGRFTAYHRLVILRRQLNDPQRFMVAFAKELSPECFAMLFRADPFKSLKTWLTPDHAVLRSIRPVNTNTGIEGAVEAQPMDEEHERTMIHDAKRKQAYALLQENYDRQQLLEEHEEHPRKKLKK